MAKYFGQYKDIDDNVYTLEIYKEYTDIIKEVRLVSRPIININSPDYFINGGLVITGVKFELLGTSTQDLLDLAISENTEYKVLIKRNNNIFFFGYLINGVYEVDFSLESNYPIKFNASDFKNLQKTKACNIYLNGRTSTFRSLFENTCIYKDFKDLVNIQITSSTLHKENVIDLKKYPGSNVYSVIDAMIVDNKSITDERGDAISDFDILDSILSYSGFIMIQWLGTIYIYEVGKAVFYNDVWNLQLSQYNSSTNLPTESNISAWAIQTLPEFRGSQYLSMSEKIDKIILKPSFKCNNNFEEFKLEYKAEDYIKFTQDSSNSYICNYAPTYTNEKDTIYYLHPKNYDSNMYADSSIYIMRTDKGDSTSKIEWTNFCGYVFALNKPHLNSNPIKFNGINTLGYNASIPEGDLTYVKITMDSYIKRTTTKDINNIGGNIILNLIYDDGSIEQSNKLCYYLIYDNEKNFDKDLVRQVKVYDFSKYKVSIYTDEQQKEFIFPLYKEPNSVLRSIQVVIEQPSFMNASKTSIVGKEQLDVWGISNIDVKLVKMNTNGEWDEIESNNPEEMVVESVVPYNNLTNNATFDYNYNSNTSLFPLSVNIPYVKFENVKSKYLNSVAKTRISRELTDEKFITPEELKIDSLYKHLNVKRMILEAEVSYVDNMKLNNLYSIDLIPDKLFIITNYAIDTEVNTVEVTLEEYIK